MAEDSTRRGNLETACLLRSLPNHGTQRLPIANDADEWIPDN